MENGKIAVARNLVNKKGCGSTEFHVLRGYLGVSPDYIQYYLLQDAYRSEAKRHMSGAVGQLRVPPDFLRESEIPLCSAGEQVRIVAKIEELFSDLDKGEESLRQAQAS
jgi:type I restriction enzyme S subunit